MKNFLKTKFDINNDDFVSVYDELPFWSAPFGLKLLDLINYRKNITALDVGFGTGFPILEVAMRLGSTCKIYGIDPWKTAVERTRKKINIYKIQNIELFEGYSENIPLPDNSIDLITSNNGINNVVDLDKTLKECSRISKKNAQLVVSFNLNTTMIEFYDIMEKILRAKGLVNCIGKMYEHINLKRKPVNEILSIAGKHGFKMNKIIEDKFEYQFTDCTTMFNHYFIQLAFFDGWKSFLDKDKEKEIFEAVESELNKISVINGVLKISVPFVVLGYEKS